MRIGPIKKHQWLDEHYQMEVAYYETKESLLRSEAGWEGSSSWGAYLKKVGVEKQIRTLSVVIWSRLVGMPRFLSSPENCDLHQDV